MEIQSSNSQKWYTVTIGHCTCNDYKYRVAKGHKAYCKHQEQYAKLKGIEL